MNISSDLNMSDDPDMDFNVKVELEIDESAGELDLAREEFETALQECLFKEEVSDSETEDSRTLPSTSAPKNYEENNQASTSPVTRPPRKRRRKENDSTQNIQSGETSPKNNKYVVKMFDRSVDLAQFSENASLYPICRAWLLNEPTQGSSSEFSEQNMYDPSCDKMPTDSTDSAENDVHFLPTPMPLSYENNERNPLIPKPIVCPPFQSKSSGADSTTELLNHNIKHWKKVRQSWKEAGAAADERYAISAEIIRDLFRQKNKEEEMETNSS